MTLHTFDSVVVSAATGGRDIDADAPIALLVHGAGMDRTVWSLQSRWLAHHGCAALAIDLPGHGASPEAERSSINDYADWIVELVNALDRPVHLVGHSMGTFIGLEAAIRCNLASLTLIGTAAAMPVHPALLDAAEQNDPLAAQLMCGWAFAPSNRTGPHPSPGGSMVGATLAMIGQAKPGVLHHDLAMCAAYETAVETAAQVTTPTTFLLGAVDRMTPVRQAQPVIEAATAPRVEIVPGCGHMVQIEASTVTRSLIKEAVDHTAVHG